MTARRDDRQWMAEGGAGNDVPEAPVRQPAAVLLANAERVGLLRRERSGLIAYLLIKVEASDWHAVQDAASDIREINAKLDVLG